MEHSQRIEQLKQLLETDPTDVFLKYGLALEIHATGDVETAIILLEEIRSHQPDYIATYYQLAMCYIELNQLEKARTIIEAGMKLTKSVNNKTYNELVALLDDIE